MQNSIYVTTNLPNGYSKQLLDKLKEYNIYNVRKDDFEPFILRTTEIYYDNVNSDFYKNNGYCRFVKTEYLSEKKYYLEYKKGFGEKKIKLPISEDFQSENLPKHIAQLVGKDIELKRQFTLFSTNHFFPVQYATKDMISSGNGAYFHFVYEYSKLTPSNANSLLPSYLYFFQLRDKTEKTCGEQQALTYSKDINSAIGYFEFVMGREGMTKVEKTKYKTIMDFGHNNYLDHDQTSKRQIR